MKACKQNGFTLLETIIVVAIIAIIAAMAIPSFTMSFSRQRTKQAAEDIVNAFNQTRVQANTSGKAAKILVSNNNRTYTVQYIRRDGDTSAKLTTNKYTINSNMNVSSNIGTELIIQPTGKMLSKTNIYFRICDGKVPNSEGYSIWINAAGNTRVISGKLTGNPITNTNCP